MDVLNLIRASANGYYNTIFSDVWTRFISHEDPTTMYWYGVLILSVLIIAWVLYFKHLTRLRLREKIAMTLNAAAAAAAATASVAGDHRGPRFRKRDKMLFYGRRMLRKMKNVSGQMYSSGKGHKRRAVMRFARRILQLQRENRPLEMKTVEPPAEYLQETTEGSEHVPLDVIYMLQTIRIFGHFEMPVFIKLCKHTTILELMPGDYLFNITDRDDSVYIVQSGLINVYICNADGSTLSLKTVRRGESVTSLLSFIDVISGNPSHYKTVTAKAIEKSYVLRLPMQAFEEIFTDNPDVMIRVIQAIMIRLQRVLFAALRNYLGLNVELVKNHVRSKSMVSGTSISHSSRHQQQPQQQQQQQVQVRQIPPAMLMMSRASREEHTLSDLDPNSIAHVHGHAIANLNAEVHGDVANVDLYHQQHQQMTTSVSRNSIDSPTTNPGQVIVPQQQQQQQTIDQRLVQSSAVESFRREFGLSEEDAHIIEPYVEVRELESNVILITEGNVDNVCVWFVMSGSLAVYQSNADATRVPNQQQQDKTNDTLLHVVHPGEIVGGLSMLTGEASAYTIKTRSNTRVAFIRRAAIYHIMRQRPRIVVYLSHGVVRRLSPLVRQCDYALDWIFLESGRAVYRQDEVSDSTYIVLSGRMRSVNTHPSGKKEIIGEYGKGDLVGIVEMITETSRTTTVMAVRDSELAKLPEGLFNAIKLRYPIVVSRLISFLSHRFLGSMQTRGSSAAGGPIEANPVTHKYSTVAVVPISNDVPISPFTFELFHSLGRIGPVLRLTSEWVRKQLGANIFESANEYRLTSWLAEQEDRNIIILYQCDGSLSPWTQCCMRQADVVLIVGLGEQSPLVGKFEREIDKLAVRTQKELVLLYSEMSNAKPANTLSWINARPWVTKHHHIQCVKRIFTRKSQYRINDLYSRVLLSEPNMHSDFSRLARWLTGNSIGVVLGGGGARGAAHIGMLKAIQEAGIPIDMVGGVSIGALMGALWCSERNIATVTQKAREWSMKMTKWFRQLLDLTYPLTSMFTGRDFNKTLHDTFGDVTIEDLWIPYFTLTTDITASCHRIHTNGSLWRYVRSSMSLSGYMPPLCDPQDGHLLLDGGYVNNLPGSLWRYCRASMSIAGVFPPFCDYRDGHLLLDGCYTNNVPADVMHSLGAAHIIAIDVGSQDDTDLTNYGDNLSGWWLLYKKWNPFTSPVKVPDLPDIQSRLAYVSCVRQLEEVKNSDYCEYVRPPIDKYKTLAFGSFDEIRDVGYVFGKNYFESMAKDGRLDRFNQWFSKEPPKRPNHASLSAYTFIDLAQIVCKLPETYVSPMADTFSEDEDYDGYISEPTTILRRDHDHHRLMKPRSTSFSENDLDSDLESDTELSRETHQTTQSSIPTTPNRTKDLRSPLERPNELVIVEKDNATIKVEAALTNQKELKNATSTKNKKEEEQQQQEQDQQQQQHKKDNIEYNAQK